MVSLSDLQNSSLFLGCSGHHNSFSKAGWDPLAVCYHGNMRNHSRSPLSHPRRWGKDGASSEVSLTWCLVALHPHVHLGYHLLVGKCFYVEQKPLPGESIIVSLERVQYRRRLQFISSVLTTPLKVSVPSGGLMELGKPPKPYNLALKRGCEALTSKSTFQGDIQRKLLCLFGGWLLSWSCTKPLLRKAQICCSLEGGEKGKESTAIKIRHMLLSFLFRGFGRISWRLEAAAEIL